METGSKVQVAKNRIKMRHHLLNSSSKVVKIPNTGDVRDVGSIRGSGRSPGGGYGNQL